MRILTAFFAIALVTLTSSAFAQYIQDDKKQSCADIIASKPAKITRAEKKIVVWQVVLADAN